MSHVTVTAALVDGGALDFVPGPDFLDRLRALQAQGVEGREIIHALLTDDWGPPPVFVMVAGTDADGRQIDIRIPYEQMRPLVVRADGVLHRPDR